MKADGKEGASILNVGRDQAGRRSLEYVFRLSVYAVLVGVVCGLAAVGFRHLMGVIRNLAFLGEISFAYDEQTHFITKWGAAVILIPAAGLVASRLLVDYLAPKNSGHGVPELMYAVIERGGRIEMRTTLVKVLSSAVTLGTGGSAGRVGPVIQFGAGFGSFLGRLVKLPPRAVIVLVGAGVAATVSSNFNAPIGGMFFAAELILPEYSIVTIMPLVIAATVGTYTSSLFLGTAPAFAIPRYQLTSPLEFLSYIALGFACAGMAVLFMKSLYKASDLERRMSIPGWLIAACGGVIVGGAGYLLYLTTGHYRIFGVGYAFIADTLFEHRYIWFVFLILAFVKIFATSVTLSAGGSGGVFAPALFIGVATGAAVGGLAGLLFPEATAPPSAYALVGMAALLAGTTGASVTSIILVFEMTRNYEIMLPLMICVVIAHFVTRATYRETIYTEKLRRRGIHIGHDKSIPLLNVFTVGEAMRRDIVAAAPAMTLKEAEVHMEEAELSALPVIDGRDVRGIVLYTDLHRNRAAGTVEDVMREAQISISSDADGLSALEMMDRQDTDFLVVRDRGHIRGYVTRKLILHKYFEKRRLLE